MSAPLVSSLKNPRFLKLWAGQCVSALGDRFAELSLLSLALAGHASAEQGRLDFWMFLPWLLFGPFAGVLVDRFPRKWLMVAADLVRYVLVLSLVLCFRLDGDNLARTYPVLFAMGLMTCVFSPAKSASLPDLVGPAQVLPAGALLAATGVIATAVGSTVAGRVIDRYGCQLCLVLDAMTFLVSAAAVLWIPFPPRPARKAPAVREILRDLGEGFREIARNAELLKICAFLFVFWFAANSVKVISIDFGKQRLGMRSMGDLTALLLWAGLGLLAGAGGTAVLGHRIARRAAYFLAAAGMGGSLFALGAVQGRGAALVCLFLTGFSGGTLVSRIEADILKVIDPGIRGRVFGATSVLFAAALLSPLLPIGWLSERMPAVALLRMLAALLAGLGAILLLRLAGDLKSGRPLLLPQEPRG